MRWLSCPLHFDSSLSPYPCYSFVSTRAFYFYVLIGPQINFLETEGDVLEIEVDDVGLRGDGSTAVIEEVRSIFIPQPRSLLVLFFRYCRQNW